MPASASPDVIDGAAFDEVDALAERLIGLAAGRGMRLATAESCTAGLLAHRLSRPFGATLVLCGGFVTYTKQTKISLLGVSADLIAACTAVHPQVAKAMAQEALARAGADIALALTGVTGAEPDEDGNPVGRVYVGFASGADVVALHCEFGTLMAPALTNLALQAALTFALARLGEGVAGEALVRARDHGTSAAAGSR